MSDVAEIKLKLNYSKSSMRQIDYVLKVTVAPGLSCHYRMAHLALLCLAQFLQLLREQGKINSS